MEPDPEMAPRLDLRTILGNGNFGWLRQSRSRRFSICRADQTKRGDRERERSGDDRAFDKSSHVHSIFHQNFE
jgi:hypothetical protein